MARIVQGITALLTEKITHEGAAAVDLSVDDPLMHLVFTKGACLFGRTFYRTQAEEIFAYSKALIAAERHEDGFAWKFAAYMRDPKSGKGNRIQGTVAPAILSAAFPDSPYIEEYVYKCLKHRADDLVLFIAHFSNLFLGEIPEAAKRGMAKAANEFDEYQLLKYATRQVPLNRKRKGRGRASLRLADALGVAKPFLNVEKLAIYKYLHAPTRMRSDLCKELRLAGARRSFFKGGTAGDAAEGRVTIEQVLSSKGSSRESWHLVMDIPGLFPDTAFKQYVRSMRKAGFGVDELVHEAKKRKYKGLWPHQVYAGYKAVVHGSKRLAKGRVCFEREPERQLVPVFDKILDCVTKGILPPGLNLGIADISGSMFCVPLGGEHSSIMVGDAAVLFAAMMSKDLGYAATFSDDIDIMIRHGNESDLEFAARIQKEGRGWGSTQVAGSVVALILYLLKHPQAARPRTLYFFSDMQFHPPCDQVLPHKMKERAKNSELRKYFDASTPPLLSAIRAYREALGPVDVVLWNMASYDNAPVPSNMDNVLMLSGFDANTFNNVTKWQESGQHIVRARNVDSTGEGTQTYVSQAESKIKNNQIELDRIRTF